MCTFGFSGGGERFKVRQKFSRGEWLDLLEVGSRCAEEASTACRRRRRREVDVEEKRAAKALAHSGWGVGFSQPSPRGALGSDASLQELRNPVRRPNVAREPIPEDLRNLVPPVFELDEDLSCERCGHPNAVQRGDLQA